MMIIKLKTIQKCLALIFNVKFKLVHILLIIQFLVEIKWFQFFERRSTIYELILFVSFVKIFDRMYTSSRQIK